jgi:hypothetical protein
MLSISADRKMTMIRFGTVTILYSKQKPLRKSEKTLAFYNKMDFRDIETEAFKDVLKSQLGKFTSDVDYCLRGLEKFSKTIVGKQAILKRKEYVRAVLLEQKRNVGANKINDLSIVSMKLSYESKVQARERGVQDENHVKIMCAIAPCVESQASLEMTRSTARAA